MHLHFKMPKISSKHLFVPFIALLSTLMVAYAPMVSITSAQQAQDAVKVQELKQKALSEIDRRVSSYKKTLETLKVNLSTDNGCATIGNSPSPSPSSSTSPSPSTTATPNCSNTALPSGFKSKSQQFLQKMIESLGKVKEKVKSENTLKGIQTLGQNVDNQASLGHLTNVQAAATQAVDSMSGVFTRLQDTYSSVKSRLTQVKDCQTNGFTADATTGQNSTDTANQQTCEEFKQFGAVESAQAESSLDVLTTIMSTIGSVLASVIGLLMSLFSSFSGLLGGLGSLGSLGNLGNLANMGNLGSLGGSLGSLTGLLGSFTAITSQLDIANGMSGNAFSSLSSLGGLLGGAL